MAEFDLQISDVYFAALYKAPIPVDSQRQWLRESMASLLIFAANAAQPHTITFEDWETPTEQKKNDVDIYNGVIVEYHKKLLDLANSLGKIV